MNDAIILTCATVYLNMVSNFKIWIKIFIYFIGVGFECLDWPIP